MVDLTDRVTSENTALGNLVTDDHSQDVEDSERLRALRVAILGLGESERELVALLITDPPLTYEEIAHMLDRPVGSIGPTRARCLEKLRAALRGAGHE